MPTIHIETFIAAPVETCFDLARSLEAHVETSSPTEERVVAPGKLSGLLDLDETVTFEGIHLGVRQRLTARITSMDRPRYFVDEQVRGAFASLVHVHEFTASAGRDGHA